MGTLFEIGKGLLGGLFGGGNKNKQSQQDVQRMLDDQRRQIEAENKSSNTGLYVGIGAGFLALLTGVIVLVKN